MKRKDKKYKPEYIEALKKHCESGLSFESFSGTIGVSRQTLYNWSKKHPEFKEAMDIGMSSRILQAEKTLWLITTGKIKGNVTGAIFLLKNIAGWRDTVEQQIEQEVTVKFAYDINEIPEPPKGE